MIALLTLNLVDIERQRRIAARQEGRVKTLIGAARPDLTRLRDGLDQATPSVRSGLRRADRLVRGLVEKRGPSAIAAAGELARSLQRSGAAGDVDTLIQITGRLLDVSYDLAAIGRGTRDDAEVLRVQTIRFKRRSLRIQRQTLRILQRSLAVQEETLVHARRIDERTGGALDPTSR
ncbi:MAG: hypothetical protein QOG77_3797 [Solirubrobacteraceae bacterium]|nr:hypothetical protein [Solirubrobacteraceae bacterium]